MPPDAIPALIEQIDELLAEPSTEEPSTLARLERTLTDGYAYALALEAERWRLERRMSVLAGELQQGNHELKAKDLEDKAKELACVSSALSSNASLLATLRGTLSQLRVRATEVRSLG